MDLSHLLSNASPGYVHQPTPVDPDAPSLYFESDMFDSHLLSMLGDTAPAPDPYSPPTPVNNAPPINFDFVEYPYDGLESLTAPHLDPPPTSVLPQHAAWPLPTLPITLRSPLPASPPQEHPSLDSPAPLTQAALPNTTSARPSLPAPILKDGFVDSGGATTFATRHPLKDVQPPRFRVRQSKSDAVKLGQAERKKLRESKAEELKEGVDAIIKSRDVSIKVLAEQLSIAEKTIQTLVNGATHYVKHRKPSVYNALVHKAKVELNDGTHLFPPRILETLIVNLIFARPSYR
jgi:hypothetical protein